MTTRRCFLASGAALAASAALEGCITGNGGRAADASAVVPPYDDTIRDRLWMWGHGGRAFDPPRYTHNIPSAPPIEMNEACRSMGIPNVCVCRYMGLPEYDKCAEYLNTFGDIKRIAMSVVDGAHEPWQKKYELVKTLRKNHPNLTTVWLDDFFTPQKLSRPTDIAAFRRQLDADGLKLASVLYPDQEGVKPEFKGMLGLCDQISIWFWHAKNIPSMKENVRKVRDLVGPGKALLMGIYMWDFGGGGKPVSDELMHRQLEIGRELMLDRQLSGLLFHPTSIVNRELSSVRIAREWIRRNGDCRI